MSVAENDLIARSLGPDAYDPPIIEREPHPFRPIAFPSPELLRALNLRVGVRVCGLCGGGLLHEIHSVDAQEAA
jgi:hypothetical protein